MADPLSICASVVSLAGAGLKLSTTLYTYSATAFKADKELRDIAENVSVTSSVLDQLGRVLEEDKKARLCSDSALKTTEGVAKRCKSVFQELDNALQKSLSKSRDGKLSAVQKMKWPFLEPKIKLAQSNLESIKSTLLLMLNVVSYARNVAQENRSDEVEQRQLIASLIETNKETNRRFEEMQGLMKGIELNTISRATTLQVDASSLLSRSSTLLEHGDTSAGTPKGQINDALCKLCQEDWPTKAGDTHYKPQDFSTSIKEIRGLLNKLIQAEQDLKIWENNTAQKSCSDIRDAFHSTIEVLRPIFDGEEGPHVPAPFAHASSGPDFGIRTQEIASRKRHLESNSVSRVVQENSVEHNHLETKGTRISVSGLPIEHSAASRMDYRKRHKRGARGGRNMKKSAKSFVSDDSDSKVQEPRSPKSKECDTVQDPHLQLRLLEGQNKNRLLMACQEMEDARARAQTAVGSDRLQDYQMQLMLLEGQNKKRLIMARQEQESIRGAPQQSSNPMPQAPVIPVTLHIRHDGSDDEKPKLPSLVDSNMDFAVTGKDLLENFDFDSYLHVGAGGEGELTRAGIPFDSFHSRAGNLEESKVLRQSESSDEAAESDIDPVQELLSEWTTVFDKSSMLQRNNGESTPAVPEWQEFLDHRQGVVPIHDHGDIVFERVGFEF